VDDQAVDGLPLLGQGGAGAPGLRQLVQVAGKHKDPTGIVGLKGVCIVAIANTERHLAALFKQRLCQGMPKSVAGTGNPDAPRSITAQDPFLNRCV
uniref:Thiolase_N domain-containing protein n=1 Tax=Steinernema glaseri TaxID=37863 RepID=A0A1I8A9R6_9BILA